MKLETFINKELNHRKTIRKLYRIKSLIEMFIFIRHLSFSVMLQKPLCDYDRPLRTQKDKAANRIAYRKTKFKAAKKMNLHGVKTTYLGIS